MKTTIELSELRTEQRGQIRTASYLKDLCVHFFPQFITGTLPEVLVDHDGEVESLTDFIKERVGEIQTRTATIEIGGQKEEFRFEHLFVDPTMPPGLKNAYMLTAHGRLVGEPISIAKRFDLGNLANGKAYSLVVSSPFLDERVDQERLSFKISKEARRLIEKAIIQATEEFLESHLVEVRSRQKEVVRHVVYEHPQLASQIPDLDEYVRQISPDMDDEKIAQNLFVLLYRDEQDISDELDELRQLDSLDEAARARAEAILQEADNQERHRLAELVVKRHQVLEIANLLLKHKDGEDGVFEKQEAIHDLILPMKQMYQNGDFQDHNLWILDDSLSQYGFFASDKPINSFIAGKSSAKEPDAIFFNPLGFRGDSEESPVAIVEFRRPGDLRTSSDPLDQVLGYIEKLRGRTAKGLDGERITDISEKTRFDCIIICDLTKSVRQRLERSLAQHSAPDGEGYYGWSREHNATIRVVSFRKMLRDAEIRNQAFWGKLGLGSPSARAKARLAKRIAERQKIEMH